MIGTTQQVAGAAGTALFVAVMTITGSGVAMVDGVTVAAATTAGIRAAFFCGAIISIAAVITAFFVKKPAGGGHDITH
jgi:DHA2 family lincomycin resistance protein-like MFS transporter